MAHNCPSWPLVVEAGHLGRAMLERDLQSYLFENPHVLFPGMTITRKQREVFIGGLRIDLLFEIDGVLHIVELKRDTIKRQDVGQIFEYYALMRQRDENTTYKMTLVAPSIPLYRRYALEEFGIRCVEVPHWPEREEAIAELVTESRRQQKREEADAVVANLPGRTGAIRFDDFVPPVTPASLLLSHQLLRNGLLDIEKAFSADYEIVPVKMINPRHPDVLCFPATDSIPSPHCIGVGAWWAFSLGHSEEMPKNDVPNISVNALPWGLDFAINAELRPSQEVMRRRIGRQPERFDRLVSEHGGLRLQAWLKIEHQPRFYHWILLTQKEQGTWRGSDLLDYHKELEASFPQIRTQYLDWIKGARPELTPNQTAHMERKNQTLNLALRLVHCFEKEDTVWNLPYPEQTARFGQEYRKFKPLIDFFNELERVE
jgi:hypothetical protein